MNLYNIGSIYIAILFLYTFINKFKGKILDSKYFILKKYPLNYIIGYFNIIVIISGLLYYITNKELYYLIAVIFIILENIYELAFGLSINKSQQGLVFHHLSVILLVLILFDNLQINKYTFILAYILVHILHFIGKLKPIFRSIEKIKQNFKLYYSLFNILLAIIYIAYTRLPTRLYNNLKLADSNLRNFILLEFLLIFLLHSMELIKYPKQLLKYFRIL